VGGWVDGWMDGRESGVKDCLQQSKIVKTNLKSTKNILKNNDEEHELPSSNQLII
jgi:hypothetical protein